MNLQMTKEEFEEMYAKASGVTVQELHDMGEIAIPCQCDYKGCKGWAMVHDRKNIKIKPLIVE